ncbi:MFS transporter, DHA1 family, putative efflux transporter [Marinactinospora thermotolerans DSM 45154]|uniref:MFS transporter, DHA1 family, putative efflux transporter n=1 Tax=Marinactinospora thermotolerans DSM 45154 TaxID=1122192 RepID=A0A1T4KDH4_9ACTN|nr:MFS transporter, DHA1 family, putative efflux transporter [Marinactinospora thermotolerans DSM 45154]
MSVRIVPLALGNFAVNTGAYLVSGLLPDIAEATGTTVPSAGLLVTVYALAYAIGAPLWAGLLGPLDRRRVLWAALGVCAVGNLLTALAPGLLWLAGARVVVAIGASVFTPTALVLAADLARPERRGALVALVVTGSALAPVLGVPAGVLLSQHLGAQAVFAVVAVLVLAAAAGIGALPQTPRPPRTSLRSGLAPLGEGALTKVLGVSALAALADSTAYTFVVPLLSGFGGATGQAVGLFLVCYGLAGAAGTSIAGWASDRFGPAVAMGASLTALALGLLALPLTDGAPLPVLLCVVLWGLGAWGVAPAAQARLLQVTPVAVGAASALNVSAIWLGMGLGGTLGGETVEELGTSGLGPVGGAVALGALALALLAARPRRAGLPAALAAPETAGP